MTNGQDNGYKPLIEVDETINLHVSNVSRTLVWYTSILAGLMDISPDDLIANTLEKTVIENAPKLKRAFKGSEKARKGFQSYIAGLREKHNFEYGEKVLFIPDGKIYDFGRIGGTGKAIIYEEGETNMQDSFAVNMSDLKKLNVEK